MASSYKYKLLAMRTGMIHKLVGQLMPAEKPTLFTGAGSSLQLCQILPYHGHKKVMVVTDEILVKLGVVKPIEDALKEGGVEVELFSEVEPDPTDEVVLRGTKIFLQSNCDCVLAVGGGSSIDAAKAIASLAGNPGYTIKDLSSAVKQKKRARNIYAIPTTSGTGSEVSAGAVISDAVTHEKTIIGVPGMMPFAAAIDTNIIKGMPPQVTAPTGMDALTHAIEAYISRSAMPESDYHAKAAVKMIMENLPKAYHNGEDLKAREIMGIAAFYAGWSFSKALLGYVHSISHRLSKHYGTPHGLANALVLPHVLEFSKDEVGKQLAELAVVIGAGEKHEGEAVLAQKFIDSVVALMEEIGIPATLDKLQESDVEELVRGALEEAHFLYAVPKYMDEDECANVIRKLLPKKASATAAQSSTEVEMAK